MRETKQIKRALFIKTTDFARPPELLTCPTPGHHGCANLEPLRGMPLKTLRLSLTKVSDLAPLSRLPLKTLQLYGLEITDLSPLRGMPLEDLWLGKYAGDLSALRGMSLRKLKLHDCVPTTDFSSLAEAKELTSLTLPAGAQNIDFLRAYDAKE